MIYLPEYFMKRERCNGRGVNIVSKPIVPLRLLQLEEVAEYYIREPEYIYLSGNSRIMCEIIFQYIFYYPNREEEAWSVYADGREAGGMETVIVRHVVWNKSNDIQQIQKTAGQDREKTAMLPDMTAYTHCCNREEAAYVAQAMLPVDKGLSQGITLLDNHGSRERWSDVEIQRRLRWGTVRAVWNNSRRWSHEEEGRKLVSCLKRVLVSSRFKTGQDIELDFMFPIEAYVARIYPHAENIELQ